MNNPSPVVWNDITFNYNLRTKYSISNDDISFVDVIAEPPGCVTAMTTENNGWIKQSYLYDNTKSITSTIDYFKKDGYKYIKEEYMLVLGENRTFIVLEKNKKWLAYTFIPEKNIILHYTGDPRGYSYFKHILLNATLR